MLNTDHAPAARWWNPERKAWTVMLLAFVLFCCLAWVTFRLVYRYAVMPQERVIRANVVQNDAVFVQRANRVQSVRLSDGGQVMTGDRITTSNTAWAGIVARLQLDQGTVGFWPATNVRVENRDRNSLRLQLDEGQVLVELQQEDQPLYFTTPSQAQEIELSAPGRYRLRVLSPSTESTAAAERTLVPDIEIASDSGTAHIGETTINAGHRLLLSNMDEHTNTWNLLRDGNFDQFDSTEYLATLQPQSSAPRSDSWIITQQPQSTGAFWRNGLFYLMDDCVTKPQCRKYARLARLGGNEKNSITAIAQGVSADVASYRAVRFEADVKIDYQSLSKGGADGSECPLFARVDYSSGAQIPGSLYFCFWAFDRGNGNTSSQPHIISTQIPPNSWQHFSADLSTLIPDLRTIKQIVFYSNGHDYDASVAGVSLQAEGLAEARQP